MEMQPQNCLLKISLHYNRSEFLYESHHLFQVCREWCCLDGQAGLNPVSQNCHGLLGLRLQLLQLRTQALDGSARRC